jgi:GGDEF domain-containing protein
MPVALSIPLEPASNWLLRRHGHLESEDANVGWSIWLRTTLTGLPNLNLFSDRLAHGCTWRGAANGPSPCCSSTSIASAAQRGHWSRRRERVLSELAVRLFSCVRAIDTVARYGGDESRSS